MTGQRLKPTAETICFYLQVKKEQQVCEKFEEEGLVYSEIQSFFQAEPCSYFSNMTVSI